MEFPDLKSGLQSLRNMQRLSLAEDTAEYFLYQVLDPKGEGVEETSDEDWETLLKQIQDHIKPYLDEYMWQRDSFNLEVLNKDGKTSFHGITGFGESIDDEWFIVFLLREISCKFPQLWIRVVDTDGEFLLIEAAHALPRWLSPEIADNRVWINQGKLFIIPRSKEHLQAIKSGSLPTLSVKDALDFIQSQKEKLLHIQILEDEAFFRIARYPEELEEHFHNALVTVPRSVALILKRRSKAIPKIVEAFYMRDATTLKICDEMPTFPPRDPVSMSVRFTKILYAQIKQQEFSPPRPFVLPPESSKMFAASELGMKLTCGLEMLVACKNKATGSKKEEITVIMNLIENEKQPTDEEIKAWDKKVDSDEWMDIDDKIFNEDWARPSKSGKSGSQAAGAFTDKAQQEKIKKMVENVQKFLNDEDAGLEGAEFGGDSDDEDDDELGDDSDESEDKEGSFDEKEFAQMMREMMGFPSKNPPQGHNSDEESDDGNEEMEIRETMAKMEQELKEAGVLEGGPSKGKGKASSGDDDDDDEIEIDYEVAKNLLESLRSQGAKSGPASNVLASMGFTMPKDDGDADEEEEEEEEGKRAVGRK